MRLPGLASRLLLARALRWTVASAAVLALFALLVDWVEGGARAGSGLEGGQAVAFALRVALLRLPGHLGRAAPLIAALGAAIAAAGLCRSGEWLALGAAGLPAWRRLLPFLALGLGVGLCGAALDAWVVPRAGTAGAQALAAARGGAIRSGELGWLARGDAVFRLRGEPGSGRIEEARAFALRDGRLEAAWAARDLRWDGRAWESRGDAAEPGLEGAGPPWGALSPPEVLGELVRAAPHAERTWAALLRDTSPASRAERGARWSRPLGCGLAALAGAALPALLGPGSLPVLLAALPVLAWEALGASAQAEAAVGTLPVAAVPLSRLGLAMLVSAGLLLRLRRP